MDEKMRCPNCGASITNTQNCEYCGSLLIRFVKQGIDISKSEDYTKKDKICLALEEAFKKNLEDQEKTQGCVTTKIYSSATNKVLASVKTSRYLKNYTGKKTFFPNAPIPSIGLQIEYRNSSIAFSKNKKNLKQFKRLKCASLFHYNQYYNGVSGYTSDQFVIDFGKDYSGASQICSEVIRNVYLTDSDDSIYCKSYYGEDKELYSSRRKSNLIGGALSIPGIIVGYGSLIYSNTYDKPILNLYTCIALIYLILVMVFLYWKRHHNQEEQENNF